MSALITRGEQKVTASERRAHLHTYLHLPTYPPTYLPTHLPTYLTPIQNNLTSRSRPFSYAPALRDLSLLHDLASLHDLALRHATNAVERRGAALESRSDQAAVLPVRQRVQRLLAVAPRLCPAAESKGQPTAAGVAADAAGP